MANSDGLTGVFKDSFEKLKMSIIGAKTTNIDIKLDKAVSDIASYKSNAGRNGYINLVKSLIGKAAETGVNLDNPGGIFGQGQTSPATFGQGGRMMRYKTYEAIISNINYCFRALNVLVDNILSPDDITKISLEINPKTFLEDEIKESESQILVVKEAIKRLKIEENLDIIVKNTLQSGDFFVEIADTQTALTSKALLAESFDEALKAGNKEIINYKDDDYNVKFIIDYSSFNENLSETPAGSQAGGDSVKLEPTSIPKKDDSGRVSIEKLQLVFHDPLRVIKLQSDLYPLCFGYLIFPITATQPSRLMADQVVNAMCSGILKSLEKRIPQISEISDDTELKNIIAAMVREGDETRAMNIRYIPPTRVQHFMVQSLKYYPYGESIFDSCQFTAKCLVALETALAVQRLSRSTEKRKISVELGLPRDARKMIENLKEEFRKRKISLDSFGTVDTIPSMISTFEDIYIPTKDGKAFVDVDTFSGGNVDIRSKVDELKFLRDSVVASLGVPPSFINIEENLSNKSALGEENILFARTIVAHQKYITHQINELIRKVFDIINPEESLTLFDNIHIALPPPKSLQFEREAKYVSDLTNLVESLERIGVPKEYSKKKFMTNMDWAEIDNYGIEEKIEKNLGTEKEEEGAGDLGGMGGTMGGF